VRPRSRISSPGKGEPFFHDVQTGSGVHPAAYLMGTEGVLSLGISWPGRETDQLLQLVPMTKNVDLYIQCLMRLNGLVLN
jgi:hypothetical protein